MRDAVVWFTCCKLPGPIFCAIDEEMTVSHLLAFLLAVQRAIHNGYLVGSDHAYL